MDAIRFFRQQLTWAVSRDDLRSSNKQVRISVLVAALQACGVAKDLQTGRKIHSEISTGDTSNKFVANTLVSMYCKCGSLEDARAVFSRMLFRTAASWTSLILGYVESGDSELGLKLFECMLDRDDAAVDARVFVAALKACACLAEKEHDRFVDGRTVKLQSLQRGMAVHARAAKLGFVPDRYVSNTLVDMYSKCGSLENARAVFDGISHPDVVSWTALVLGYADNDEEEEALKTFSSMLSFGVVADALSFVGALKACLGLMRKSNSSSKFMRDKVVEIHLHAAMYGCDVDARVASSLIDLYAKCESLADARRLFEKTNHLREVVLWTAMILAYAEDGEAEHALELFQRMIACDDACEPNHLTYVAALKACTCLTSKEVEPVKLKSLERGMIVHAHAVKSRFDTNIFVANTLVDMYSKCGSLVDASKVFFYEMPARSVVSWNAFLLGCAENDEEMLALELFQVMKTEGCEPDALTYATAFKACGSLAEKETAVKGPDGTLLKPVSLNRGIEVHSKAVASGYKTDTFVASSLVTMYSKCGNLEEAWNVFEGLPHDRVDVVSWTSLIMACAENNQPELALNILTRLPMPDAQAFAAALKACATLATLETVREAHARIIRNGFETDLFLMNCLVEVYGKSGSIMHAQHVFDSLAEIGLVTWNSLLAGYSRLGETKKQFHLFDKFQHEGLRPDAVTFVYLLSACSHAGDVRKGEEFFHLMSSRYDITPGMEHYVCMVDLFGRTNQLKVAVDVVNSMPFKADALTWLTVLGACQKWKNVKIGKLAFENLMKLNEKQDAVFALMANIYGSVGLWEQQSKVEAMRKRVHNKTCQLR